MEGGSTRHEAARWGHIAEGLCTFSGSFWSCCGLALFLGKLPPELSQCPRFTLIAFSSIYPRMSLSKAQGLLLPQASDGCSGQTGFNLLPALEGTSCSLHPEVQSGFGSGNTMFSVCRIRCPSPLLAMPTACERSQVRGPTRATARTMLSPQLLDHQGTLSMFLFWCPFLLQLLES